MKNKRLLYVPIIVLLLILALTSCSNKEDTKEVTSKVEEDLVEYEDPDKDIGDGVSDIKDDLDTSLLKNTKDVKQLEEPTTGDLVAELVTSAGSIKIKLLEDAAPKAVENFINLAEEGFYNSTDKNKVSFYRIDKDSFIQTGDPNNNGAGGKSSFKEPFETEVNTTARHYRGAVSMANKGPRSKTNTSEFFIVQKERVDDNTISMLEESLDLPEYKGFISKDIVYNYKTIGGLPELDFGHSVFGQVYEGLDVVDDIANLDVDNSGRPVANVYIKEVKINRIK